LPAIALWSWVAAAVHVAQGASILVSTAAPSAVLS
jgi:hypothetical protein